MRGILIFLAFIITFQVHALQTLKVGTLGFAPPFSLQIDSSGRSYGFEIGLMDEICKRINAKCVYRSMQFQEFFKGLNDGKIDLAIGSIIITKNRSQKFLFSIPYLVSKGSFVVLKQNNYKSIQELKNKTIGTIKGSVYLELAQLTLGPSTKVIGYPNPPDLIFALKKSAIDALILNFEPCKYLVANNSKLMILGDAIETGSGYRVMTNLFNDRLIKKINEAILSMEKDGSYLKLYNQFLFL